MRVFLKPDQLLQIQNRFNIDRGSKEKFMDWIGMEMIDGFVELNNGGIEIDADSTETINDLNGLYSEVQGKLGA
jgi:hypothetical protein